jgi:hypothetical protein
MAIEGSELWSTTTTQDVEEAYLDPVAVKEKLRQL